MCSSPGLHLSHCKNLAVHICGRHLRMLCWILVQFPSSQPLRNSSISEILNIYYSNSGNLSQGFASWPQLWTSSLVSDKPGFSSIASFVTLASSMGCLGRTVWLDSDLPHVALQTLPLSFPMSWSSDVSRCANSTRAGIPEITSVCPVLGSQGQSCHQGDPGHLLFKSDEEKSWWRNRLKLI